MILQNRRSGEGLPGYWTLKKKVQDTAEYRVWRKSTKSAIYCKIHDLKKKYLDTAGYRIWRRSITILQDTGSEEGVHGYCRIQDMEKKYYNTAGYRI